MIFNILDNTTELRMTKYIIGEIFSSGGATLYRNHSDQTVIYAININQETSMKSERFATRFKITIKMYKLYEVVHKYFIKKY